METKQYKYDAFISYRHCDLDQYVAETLHKRMESFKAPKNVINKEDVPRKKINRVFRDLDELPLASNLEDPIIDALENSEYLIVICSPRLKESMWCKKEIQTFIKMHGRQKILAVLVEGEPADSFPEELLYDERKTMDEHGVYHTERKLVEPLAADFRGANHKEINKAMKSEILRLLAPMFGVTYDDLKQRHKEQRVRKTLIASLIAGGIGIAFGIYSTLTAIQIQAQKKQIEEQTIELANSQAHLLSQQALDLFEKDHRKDAVSVAYQAMTQFQGIDMPQTAEAEYTLSQCLSVYDGAATIRAADQVEMPGIIRGMKASPSGEYVLTSDNSGNLFLWNMASRTSLMELDDNGVVDSYGFIGDEAFYYLSDEEGVKKITIADESVQVYKKGTIDDFDFIYEIMVTPDATKMIVHNMGGLSIVDLATMEKISEYKVESGKRFENLCEAISDDVVYALETSDSEQIYLAGISIKDGSLLFETQLPEGEAGECYLEGNQIYAVGYLTEDLVSGKSWLVSIDAKTGEKSYEQEYSSMLASKIIGNTTNLLLMSGYEAIQVEAKTGELLERYYARERICYNMISSNGDFMLYTENGNCHSIQAKAPYVDYCFNGIVCNKVEEFAHAVSGMVGYTEHDNRLVLYCYVQNADAFVYTDELLPAVEKGVLGEDATTWGKENHVDRPSFINAYLPMKDANLMLVSYIDGSVALYREDTMELLKTYQDCPIGNYEYFGKVGDYYTVISSYTGYLFDKDGACHAKVPSMEGVTKDSKNVVVFGKDEDRNNADIAIPAYTRNKLVEKASNYLKRTKSK